MLNKIYRLSLLVLLTGCNTSNPNKRTIANALLPTSIAELTIHAFDGNSEKGFLVANMGHAYLSFINRQSTPLQVGDYLVEPDEELYIGTWGQAVHWGVWYNMEPLYLKAGRYEGRVSLTRGINSGDEITKITSYINEHNYWSFAFNCTSFATGLWNEVAGSDKLAFKNFMNPTNLRNSLQDFDSFVLNRPLENMNSYQTASYYDGTGLFTYALDSEVVL